MALSLNIYKNHERLLLGTRALPIAQADSFKLYWSPVDTGPYTLVKEFPNVPDKTLYPGNALVSTTRTDLGVLLSDVFFMRITSVKGGTESNPALSDLTTIPPEGAETNDEMREELTNAAQLFGYNETTGLWQRVTTNGDGKLETTAILNVSGTGLATEAKQDGQISILNSIDAGIPVALGAATSANSMPVVFATDMSPLEILDVVDDSQQTDVPVSVTPVEVLQAGPATPLIDRKLVVLQNNSNRDIYVGDATLQNHRIPKRGGVRSFSAGPGLVLWARTDLGSATLNVWELG